MSYKGKKRKVKNPLIWANWKLREQLHAAKEEIAELEIKKSEFFTVALHMKERRPIERCTSLFVSHTYSSLSDAIIAFNFIAKGNGVTFCDYEIKLLDSLGRGLFYFVTSKFHPETESEVTND
jgi:hypothetical protein